MTTQIQKITTLAILSLFLFATFACTNSEETAQTSQAQTTGEVHNLVFEAYMTGYVGVGGEFDGVENPVIEANEGDEINIRVINKEAMAHDIALDGHNVASEMLMKIDDETSISFIATANDQYYCTVPGHKQTGMVGELRVN